MKASHADFMAEQLLQTLLSVWPDYHAKMLAKLAGCSTSELYTWRSQGMQDAKASYVMALASGLAEEYQDYRFIKALLPTGDKIIHEGLEVQADGRVDDEAADAAVAMGQAVMAHRGKNPDGIAQAREQLRDIEKRLEEEERMMRAQQAG